jgi:hypothetical protein
MNTRDLLAGAGVGAALALMFDPAGGRRRRALVRDKAVRASRVTRNGLDATARDIAHRARGMAAATRGRFVSDEPSDDQLIERVRSKLGRVCSHPRALDVDARGGEVTLRGPILATEVDRVVATAAAVRGVQSVVNELDAHEDASGIPSLQGEGRVAGPSLDVMQHNWAPATRALVTAGVVATGVYLASHAGRSPQTT